MGFFGRGAPKAEPASATATTSAAAWQSIAAGGGDGGVVDGNGGGGGGGDGSGFLHPESGLESNRSLLTSEWSKERSNQQLELEDVHDRTNGGGCCRTSLECAIGTLHVVNLCLAITMLVYGSLILTQFEQPAMAAVLFNMVAGSSHFVTSFLGMASYFWDGCYRGGMMLSAFVGPYFAFVYLTIVVSLAVDENGLLTYLDDHKEVMYLGPNVAEKCSSLMPLFYTILVVLGLLEASRFCVMVRIRDRLRRRDAADPLIPRPGKSSASVATSSSAANKSLTEALLMDDDNKSERAEAGEGGDGGGAVGRETTGTPNWWDTK